MDKGTHQLSSFFRLMGNGIRFEILLQLREGNRKLEEIVNRLDRSVDTVSRHLGTLRNYGLVGDSSGEEFELERPDLLEKCLEFRNYLAESG